MAPKLTHTTDGEARVTFNVPTTLTTKELAYVIAIGFDAHGIFLGRKHVTGDDDLLSTNPTETDLRRHVINSLQWHVIDMTKFNGPPAVLLWAIRQAERYTGQIVDRKACRVRVTYSVANGHDVKNEFESDGRLLGDVRAALGEFYGADTLRYIEVKAIDVVRATETDEDR